MFIRNGNFGWAKDQDTLHSIELIIPRSKLTLVIGPVACGKFTLCKVFLGEPPAFRGVIDAHEHSEMGGCEIVLNGVPLAGAGAGPVAGAPEPLVRSKRMEDHKCRM